MIRRTLFVCVLLALFFLLVFPFAVPVRDMFLQDGEISIASMFSTVSDPHLSRPLANSLALAFSVTLLSTLIALPPSAALGRWTFPGRNLLIVLFVSPLVIPSFIGAVGLQRILERLDPLNLLLIRLGVTQQGYHLLDTGGPFGLMLIETVHYSPLVFLMLLRPMALTGGSVEEAAAGLGGGWTLRTRRIVVPMIRPSLAAGMLMVFLWSLADLGAPLVFDCRNLAPVMIYDSVNGDGISSVGSVLVIALIAIVVVVFLVSRWLFGKQIAWRSVPESMLRPSPLRGWLLIRKLVWIVPLAVVAAMPALSILLNALAGQWSDSLLPQSYTLSHFAACFSDPLSVRGLGNSLSMSLRATLLDVGLALLIVHLVVRRPMKGERVVDFFASLPLVLPGVALAFAYLSLVWGTSYSPLHSAGPVLMMAYTARRLPYMVRSIGVRTSAIPATCEIAARSLGASAFRVWRKVTVPLFLPGIVAGAIVTFTFCLMEVGCSLLLTFRVEDYTLAKSIWTLFARAEDGTAAASALAVVGVLFLLVALAISFRLLGQRIEDLFAPSTESRRTK